MSADSLTRVEAAKLENYEVVIEGGLKSFVEVGRALMAIRDERLYRATHGTFEEYCRERWQLQRAYAYRLIEAAEVVERVSPMGDKVPLPPAPLPTSERQVRPLTRLPPSDQAPAWREAVKTAPNGKPTAAHVEEVVARRLEVAPPRPAPPRLLPGEEPPMAQPKRLDSKVIVGPFREISQRLSGMRDQYGSVPALLDLIDWREDANLAAGFMEQVAEDFTTFTKEVSKYVRSRRKNRKA